MNNIKLKRIGAYIIDYLFVFLLITMLSQIRALNPNYEEYAEAYARYEEIYDDLTVDNALEIAESQEYKQVNYDLSRYSVSISVISLVVYLAYFVGFQKWNNNQTLGKKVFSLQVVENDNKKVGWLQMLWREVVLYNLIWKVLAIVSIWIFNYEGYMYASSLLTLISGAIVWANIFFVVIRNDSKGIHDLLAKTKVVERNMDNGNR